MAKTALRAAVAMVLMAPSFIRISIRAFSFFCNKIIAGAAELV
jgi:hypothetical protein